MSQRKPIVVTLISVLLVLAPLCMPAWVGEAIPRSGAEDDAGGAEAVHPGGATHAPWHTSEGVAASSMALTRLPLYFIENQGQLDERVGYYVQGRDKTLYFTSQGLTFVLGGSGERWAVKLDFVGANPGASPAGEAETGAVVSYFKGQPEDWVTGLKTYSRVVYRDLWPGIDLEYSGTVSELKYQFAVGPGADPSQIKLAYRGADIAVNERGQLEVSTPAGGFEDGAPYAYQPVEGGEQKVDVSYELGETLGVSETPRVYGFRIGTYDPSRVLLVDPIVLFSCGYIGGSDDDEADDVAVDSEGNAYVTGWTYSTASSFPDTVGPDTTQNGRKDAFVAKVGPGGGHLVYCGYIGGSSDDSGFGIAVDGQGRAYVTGRTESSAETFPETVGPDPIHNGSVDAFVARVDADGTGLDYCGYIGGTGYEYGHGIAVDGLGSAYVTGYTASNQATFPEALGPDLTYNGGTHDAFVAKVNASGTGLSFCGYIGGAGDDRGLGIAVDASGRAYVVGETTSTEDDNFPLSVGPDLYHNGSSDAFVAKVSASGLALDYCGYIGGDENDYGYGIAVSSAGNAYVTGRTASGEAEGFPVTVGPDLTFGGYVDCFVAKVSSGGGSLVYCGYIGGSNWDECRAIAVDGYGQPFVTGETGSTEEQGFPLFAGPDLTYNGGARDAFVARVSSTGGSFSWSGYVGGEDNEVGLGIALQHVGADYTAHIVGRTASTQSQGFPLVIGPDLTYNGADLDAFVARVGYNHAPTLGTVTPDSGSGPTGDFVGFTTSWHDIDNWRDLKHVYFHIGASPSLAGNVTLMYNRAKHKLWIRSDDGLGWLGGCAPGDVGFIENSQAALWCYYSTMTYSGTDTMNVSWVLLFKSGYTGAKKTGIKCKDRHKAKAKGAWKGTWTITE
jgi:hypothetical protein